MRFIDEDFQKKVKKVRKIAYSQKSHTVKQTANPKQTLSLEEQQKLIVAKRAKEARSSKMNKESGIIENLNAKIKELEKQAESSGESDPELKNILAGLRQEREQAKQRYQDAQNKSAGSDLQSSVARTPHIGSSIRPFNQNSLEVELKTSVLQRLQEAGWIAPESSANALQDKADFGPALNYIVARLIGDVLEQQYAHEAASHHWASKKGWGFHAGQVSIIDLPPEYKKQHPERTFEEFKQLICETYAQALLEKCTGERSPLNAEQRETVERLSNDILAHINKHSHASIRPE